MPQLSNRTTLFNFACLSSIIACMYWQNPGLLLFTLLVELSACSSSIYDFFYDNRKVNLANGLLCLGCAVFTFLTFMRDYIV